MEDWERTDSGRWPASAGAGSVDRAGKVQGTWKTATGNLTLTQQFKMLTATRRHSDQQRQDERRSSHVHDRRHDLHRARQRQRDLRSNLNATEVN